MRQSSHPHECTAIVSNPSRRSFLNSGAILVAALSERPGLASFLAGPSDLKGDPVLGTARQQAAEKRAIRLLNDPMVRKIQQEARAVLLSGLTERSRDAEACINHAITLFTASLILDEMGGNPDDPAFIWLVDDAPRSWLGLNFPGSGISGDNPDQIYRTAHLDGSKRYLIEGEVPLPSQFRTTKLIFSFIREQGPGLLPLQESGKVFLGNQLATLTEKDLQISSEGRFSFIAGGPGSTDHDHHVALEPGPVFLLVRDIMSDWKQRPSKLSIRVLDSNHASAPLGSDIRQRVLEHLPAWLRYWGTYRNRFLGGIQPNSIKGPFSREGRWGCLAGVRFHLKPDEAVLLKTMTGNAPYTGIHVQDPWMIVPDARRYQSSLNLSQARADTDGSYTYVACPSDPGVANWLDTAGLREGILFIRWIGLPPDWRADELLRDFRIINLSELANGGHAAVPRVNSSERRAQLTRRGLEYDIRLH